MTTRLGIFRKPFLSVSSRTPLRCKNHWRSTHEKQTRISWPYWRSMFQGITEYVVCSIIDIAWFLIYFCIDSYPLFYGLAGAGAESSRLVPKFIHRHYRYEFSTALIFPSCLKWAFKVLSRMLPTWIHQRSFVLLLDCRIIQDLFWRQTHRIWCLPTWVHNPLGWRTVRNFLFRILRWFLGRRNSFRMLRIRWLGKKGQSGLQSMCSKWEWKMQGGCTLCRTIEIFVLLCE